MARDRARAAGKSLLPLYWSKRWRDLRLEIAARDGWVGVPGLRGAAQLNEIAHHPDSLTVNHKRPHRSSPALFWNEDNLQAVCHAFHHCEKQRIENTASGGEGWG